jgi:hypothetical protein
MKTALLSDTRVSSGRAAVLASPADHEAAAGAT